MEQIGAIKLSIYIIKGLGEHNKGPLRFCHFKEKRKSLTFNLWSEESIWHTLKILRSSLVVKEPL